MRREKLQKQPSGRLIESLKMERVRTILTHRYPYPHEHLRHFMIAVTVCWLFLFSLDNLQTLIMKLDKNFKWWPMYSCLIGFLYFFSSQFIRKTIKPNYSNFSRWYSWIILAAFYRLPSFQSMWLDLRMNLSLFLTIYISSLVFLIVFHAVLLGLWYLGLVSHMAEKKPEMLTIIKNCAMISIACCMFYSHCGNMPLSREKSIDRRTASTVAFSLWRKQNEDNTLILKLLRMDKFKDQICSSLFAPVGSVGDYPLLSKWAIYGELGSNGSEYSNIISPVYSLWATFIGLYMANYVVERSTGHMMMPNVTALPRGTDQSPHDMHTMPPIGPLCLCVLCRHRHLRGQYSDRPSTNARG